MDTALLAPLVALALVDSTSIGTLVVPVWMMLVPGRPPVRRLLLYLGVLGTFYLILGLVLLALTRGVRVAAVDVLDRPGVQVGQLVLGVALFAWSFRFDSAKRREAGVPDRLRQWRGRVSDPNGSSPAVAGLAVAAGVAEVVTMLPYLAAIAMVAAAEPSIAVSIVLLAGYCLVMVLPAIVLLQIRLVAGARLTKPLAQLDSFVSEHGDTAIGWTFGLVGFYLAADAASALFVR
ncbi:cytochrome c biogenesis protein CcdA [Rhodococcus sp. 27YEA15]|uniref:GAP family protein n=1 Tax=Rhodococcus sp. 27YEA15 TaxID=3156259 RepID=UPI003C7CB222